jgi:hypothetical protein
MTKTMYRACPKFAKINIVQVIKETECTITTTERDWQGNQYQDRRRKSSDFYSYFNTWEEARNFCIKFAERGVEAAKKNVDYMYSKLSAAKSLPKEPPPGETKT